MKRILFYCQHLLGMGHFMRSAALVAGLSENFEITFLNGGEIIPGFVFPAAVKVVNLPPIKSDEGFSQIQSAAGDALEEVKQRRVEQILATFERLQPNLVVIELYPFGRKKFSFELLPLLARIRLSTPKPQVVCSLRDILVSRPGQESYEAQVCDLLNRYFDLLLIHADPQFQPLDETFHSVDRITIPIVYTGYVAQQDAAPTGGASLEAHDGIVLDEVQPLLLASIGGGRVGYELLAATVAASVQLYATWPHQLVIFSGPYLPDEQFTRIEETTSGHSHIQLRRYTTHFLFYMERAALSISMAGYNTCVNILSTKVRAMVLPFRGGDNNEQSVRAAKLAANGVITLLQPEELTPERLSSKIIQALNISPASANLTLDGVAQSVARLVVLANKGGSALRGDAGSHASSSDYETLLARELRPTLESHPMNGPTIDCFVRDDDIDVDEESLRHLFDIALSRGVPLNLAVIPARLTPEGTKLLKTYKKLDPDLLELHQHGWRHLNHEANGRKCEFGVSRSYEEQFDDLRRGKVLLEETFGERFFPAFTPPWNRCTPQTLRALDELGFKVFSKDKDPNEAASPLNCGHNFHEISITLNFMAKGGDHMRPPDEIIETLVRQMHARERIGIMLHHKIMDAHAFAFLDALLAELRRYPFVHFHTFAELHELAQLPTPYAFGAGVVHVEP